MTRKRGMLLPRRCWKICFVLGQTDIVAERPVLRKIPAERRMPMEPRMPVKRKMPVERGTPMELRTPTEHRIPMEILWVRVLPALVMDSRPEIMVIRQWGIPGR